MLDACRGTYGIPSGPNYGVYRNSVNVRFFMSIAQRVSGSQSRLSKSKGCIPTTSIAAASL